MKLKKKFSKLKFYDKTKIKTKPSRKKNRGIKYKLYRFYQNENKTNRNKANN